MSEHAQYGIHPDADLLGAFAEGALPEHERAACLEHLAGCPECREIVFVAQAAAGEAPEPAKQPAIPAPRRRRWFAPIAVWAGAAAVVVLAVSVVVFSRYKESTPPHPQLMASATPPGAEELVAPQPAQQDAPASLSISKKAIVAKSLARSKAAEPEAAPPPAVEAMKSAAPVPENLAAPPATAPLAFAPQQSAPVTFASAAPSAPLADSASVTGAVTDPAGGAIAKVQVSLTDPAANKTFGAATDSRGEYSLTGIPPGHYQLSFASPGFKNNSKNIDLQPQQIARADSSLQIGNVAESVSVTAESAAVNMSTAARAGGGGGGGGRGGGRGGRGGTVLPELPLAPRSSVSPLAPQSASNTYVGPESTRQLILLPNKQPAVTTAVNGKITLAADSNGALFLSTNSGKTWKEIKGKWKGKVVRVVASILTADATGGVGAAFQLNTDSGTVWTSKDGSHWNPAPPAR